MNDDFFLHRFQKAFPIDSEIPSSICNFTPPFVQRDGKKENQ